jgi:hypothetical protein
MLIREPFPLFSMVVMKMTSMMDILCGFASIDLNDAD